MCFVYRPPNTEQDWITRFDAQLQRFKPLHTEIHYYNTAIQKGTNVKDLWKNFRKIKNNDNNNTQVTSLPTRIVYNGAKIKDTPAILNSLNDHFINIAKIVNKVEFKESPFY